MRRFSFLCALPTLAVLALTSISARAEVPQSRVVLPKEDRVGPRERALQEDQANREAGRAAVPASRRVAAHREARRQRSAGIVLTAVGASFAPLGGFLLASSLKQSGDGLLFGDAIGGGLLAIGGVSLMIGIPMLVSGVSDSRATAMPTIQVGPRSAALTWSF